MAQLTKNEILSYFKNEIKQYKILLGGIISEDYRSHIERVILCYEAAITSIEKGERIDEQK